jgi:hypothetical protein
MRSAFEGHDADRSAREFDVDFGVEQAAKCARNRAGTFGEISAAI